MAVQQEIKSQLAKLLATEDLVVEHKNVDSAQFNVHTRVLILPLWERASNHVYDMLVGHEVGHALFTPDKDPPRHIPHQFVNVVEDARIEKLMKRKYMGIAKSFYKGYSELYHNDFFELDGEDITEFNLADRANLYFKVGSFLPISFSSTEKPIIDLIHDCETFDDTLSAAEALYNFCKQEQEEQKESFEIQQKAKLDFEQDLESSGDSSNSSTPDSESTVPDTDSSSSVEDRSDSTSGNDWVVDSDTSLEPEVQTVDALDSKLKDLVNSSGVENVYVEIPKVELENIIVSNEEVHEYIDNDWKRQCGLWEKSEIPITLKFDEVDAEYVQFKRDAQKEVSYLVKEFECRKSASAYARSATSRTGVLDTTKLQTYRFNEDLFKRVTTLPDGKNHGLVFILDWSGSMQYVLQDTLKQLYNLIWFCKKVQIPFEVYAFTNEWSRSDEIRNKSERREGVLYIDNEFNLMNLFSSKVNAKTLDHHMNNAWRISQSFRVSTHYVYPERLVLSGTPLNETILCLHEILPQFQKENGVEKVQCIILTDGEAGCVPYHKEVKRHWEFEPYLGTRNINPHTTFLRDRKLGKIYKFGFHWHEFADILLTNLKDRFPSMSLIGIRVLAKRDASSFIRMYGCDGKVLSDWRKNKSFSIKNSGYDAYFGLSSTALAEDSEFDVDEDATKAQIKRAFVKSLKTKKLNKKVLGEFIELVA